MLNPGKNPSAEQGRKPFATSESPRPADEARKPITIPKLQREPVPIGWAILASVVSLVAHVVLGLLLLLINFDSAPVQAGDVGETRVEEEIPEKVLDLTNIDLGIESTLQTNYNVERTEEVSVP